MFSKYFEESEKKLLKTYKAGKSTGTKKETKSKASKTGGKSDVKPKTEPSSHVNELLEVFKKIIPKDREIGSVKIIDPGGYSPEGVDFAVYNEFCRDIVNIMSGFVPSELVYGAFHVCDNLDAENLNEIIRRVVQTKKLNRYAENVEEPSIIPSFIVAYETDYSLTELKKILIDKYISMSIDHVSEVDIIMIFNTGIIIKDWKSKRSYVALETKKDSFMWFFILMNEYIDVDKNADFDLRNYVQHTEKYNEY